MNGMRKEVYVIPEREVKRYVQHGIAKLDFNSMCPFPTGSGFIELRPLLDAIGREGTNPRVGKPAAAWVQRGDTPVIIVSSGLQKSDATKSPVIIDTVRKEAEYLKFHYCPKAGDNHVLLEPIYKELRERQEQPAAACI